MLEIKTNEKAADVFEKLGFEKVDNDKYGFTWRDKKFTDLFYTFSLPDKTFSSSSKYSIDMRDLEAIIIQCKELGWDLDFK